MSEGWHWETRDAQGTVRAHGSFPMWGVPEEQKTDAELFVMKKMARLVWRAAPDYDRLQGWRVRVWSERLGFEAVTEAGEWLDVLRSGARGEPQAA